MGMAARDVSIHDVDTVWFGINDLVKMAGILDDIADQGKAERDMKRLVLRIL